MKRKILIILGIIVLLLIICGLVFCIDYENVSNNELPTSNVESSDDITINNDIIIIKDGKIQNENLIDTFIENSNNKQTTNLEIDVTSNENTDVIKLEYVPAEKDENQNDNSSSNSTVIINGPNQEFTYEDYQKYYGYYKMTKNEKEEKFDALHWNIKRLTDGNTVQVIFNSNTIDLAEIPVICEYNLDSSLYEKAYDLTYLGRKDNGIKQIAKTNQFDNIDYGLYTLAGDLTVTIEQDMVYSLEDALKEKIISVQSILDQAKIDEKYGICETAFYSDGGSIEYRYKDYTILKLNSLDGNRDLIIGFSGTIINNEQLKNESYKDAEEKNIQEKYSKVSISIKENTLTKTGATIIISDISEPKNTYGEWFRIDKKTNGFWDELKSIDENYGFNDIGLIVGEDDKLEINADWSKKYGELEKGEYRLVKELYDGEHIYLAVEFTIE